MTYEDAFPQAIIEQPEDDTPRLVFADWLDEHGQPERAEFIRVQCELARLVADDPRRKDLQLRERKLLAEHSARWLGRLHGTLREKHFRRGFLERVRLNAQSFVAHEDALFRLGPVREVSLVGAATHIILVAASPYLLRLRQLELRGGKTWLGDRGVGYLARSPYIDRLSRLDLSNNHVGDEGARHLAASPHLGRLVDLWLAANQIGEDGLRALVGSAHLGGLAFLDLSGNGIDRTRQGARALLGRFGDRVRL